MKETVAPIRLEAVAGRNSSSSLATALDTSAGVISWGDQTFWRCYSGEYYGDSTTRVDDLETGETAYMDAWVYGSGTVTFYWRMSVGDGENYDEFRFYVDGVLQDEISGDVSWTQQSYNISGSGLHVLMWEYEKIGTPYGVGFVDYMTWTGETERSSENWDICEYVYNPAGQRIAKQFDGETAVKYLYDGDQCIAEYDGDDNLLRKYIYGPGIDQPICMIDVEDSGPALSLSNGAVSYYHYDGLGSVVALSDEDGDTVQVYEYDVYGNVAASDPNHTNPFMFTGRRMDSETGLYFYRARYYNPALGRFLQTDPIGHGDGMNMYAYCGNNPIGSVDHYGLAAAPPDCNAGLCTYTSNPHSDGLTYADLSPQFGLGGVEDPVDVGLPNSGSGGSCGEGETAIYMAMAGILICVDGALPFGDMLAGYTLGDIILGNLATGAVVGVAVNTEATVTEHQASRPGGSLRATGPPNSTAVEDRGNGQGTIREYGPDGRATVDYDFGHPHHPGLTEPHAHDWTWSEDGHGSRDERNPRSVYDYE